MVNFINTDDIDADGRLRPVDRDHAEFLAVSIKETGLKHPIIVRTAPEGSNRHYKLVVGGHRLDAFKLLRWTDLTIGKDVVIQDMTDDEARLAEIDENLARHELNALDRAIFLLERKRLYETLYPETGHGKAPKGRAKEKSQTLALFRERFSRQAAKKLGLSEAAIKLSIQIASDLDREAVKALRGTKIERNQRELFAISRLPVEEQRAVAAAIGGGKAKTMVQAKVAVGLEQAIPKDPQTRFRDMLIAGWDGADKVTRAWFLDYVSPKTTEEPAAPTKGGRK